jgi:cytochrome bd-type quinol oxidase subunit 1
MGVVAGIVMAGEIRTNWGRMSEFAVSSMEPILSCEVLLLFGWAG